MLGADERDEIQAAAPVALRSAATRLDARPEPDRDELKAATDLDEAYRLRQLSFGTVKAVRDALESCGERAPGMPMPTRRARIDTTRQLVRMQSSTRSVWLRNSLRGAAGLALAVLVGQLSDLQHRCQTPAGS